MRIPILFFLSIIPAGFPAESLAASYSWEAMLPTEGGHASRAEFSGALETANGDIVVAGQGIRGEYVARLHADGKLRWLSDVPDPGESVGWYLGIRETKRGIVSLWGYTKWSAFLYTDSGMVASRFDLGFPRGSLDVTQSARVLTLSNEPGLGRTMISAEGRNLIGGSAWKTSLAPAWPYEVVGIHAVGDSAIAVLDRMGGAAGDTLTATLLNASGMALWSRDVPTGKKPDGYTDNQSILWTRIAYDGSGRIVLAGLVAGLPVTPPDPGAMALAVFTPGGEIVWLKRFPLDRPADPPSRNDWQIDSLSASVAGIRVCLSHKYQNTWSKRNIPWSGENVGSYLDTPPLDLSIGTFDCEPLSVGSWLGFGSTSAPGGLKLPHDPADSTSRAVGLGYPLLFGPVPKSGKQWSETLFPEYADTVWEHPSSNPEAPPFLQTEGPGFYFLAPTKDGGAVVGGRLWRRNGQDTLSVIAIKIPPEEIGALPIRPPLARVKVSGSQGAIPFDASGRFRRKAQSPVFLYRP